MKFHVLTLFPEMLGLAPSIIGRAAQRDRISINAVNIRDYSLDRHKKVDDYPYGGGAGMLMQAQPVYDAHKAVTKGRRIRTIYVTPQGMPFSQKIAQELAQEEELIFLCGHYEGIDERVLEEVVTDYLSIGDYVLTGGELPAMVIMDAVARLIPGVLGNDMSAEEESFYNDLLEYPQYSRPEVWHGKRVPQVLLSGNHRKVSQWRLEQSILRTEERRPDLAEIYRRKQRLTAQLAKNKRNNIHMIESIARGCGEILYEELESGGGNLLVYDRLCKICMILAEDVDSGERLVGLIPDETVKIWVVQPFMSEVLWKMRFQKLHAYIQVLYPQKVALPVRHKDIHLLSKEDLEAINLNAFAEMLSAEISNADCQKDLPDSADGYDWEHKRNAGLVQWEEILADAANGLVYGAFQEGIPVGMIVTDRNGRLGLPIVAERFAAWEIAKSLIAGSANHILEKGRIPYAHVDTRNQKAVELFEELGFYKATAVVMEYGNLG